MTNERYKEVCDSISQEDIDIVLNLCPDKIKNKLSELLTQNPPMNSQDIVISLIQLIRGELFSLKDGLNSEQSKIKSMQEYEEMFGKELSDKLRELNDKYNIDYI